MSLFVSIIVPNYNHSLFLEARLESIFSQTYQNFELILLDDYSSDNSLEILSKYSSHPKVSHFIINTENSGTNYKQWNKGISLAKGDLIWIAESDDTCNDYFLEKLVRSFLNEKVQIAYSQSNSMNSEGEIVGDWYFQTAMMNKPLFDTNFTMDGINFIDQFLLQRNVIPNASGVLFRKTCFDIVNGAREDVRYCADWLLWLHMLSLNGEVYYTAEKLNNFRFHPNSVIASSSKTSNIPFKKRFDILMRKEYSKILKELNLLLLLKKQDQILKKEILEEILFLSKLKKTRLLLGLVSFRMFFFHFNVRQKLSFLKQTLFSI